MDMDSYKMVFCSQKNEPAWIKGEINNDQEYLRAIGSAPDYYYETSSGQKFLVRFYNTTTVYLPISVKADTEAPWILKEIKVIDQMNMVLSLTGSNLPIGEDLTII